MSDDFITLGVTVPATLSPTFIVERAAWEAAKEKAKAGEQVVLVGATGGYGCRGGVLPAGMAKITLTGPENQHGNWPAEWDEWGKVWLHEDY